MIPTRISLLSNRKKDHLEHMVYVQFTKHTIETVLVLICIIAMILLGAEVVLNSHFSALNNNVAVSARRVSELNKKVQFINGSIARIEALNKETISWSTRIEAVTAAIPDSITLNQLSMDEKNGTYRFSGTAQTREDLLLLQEQLEIIDWIDTVEIPISQLTTREQVPFSITATLIKKADRPK